MSGRHGNRKHIRKAWQSLEGADIRYLVPKPEDCQKKCASNPNCLSWTYKKTAGNGNGVAGTASNCLNKANLEKMTPNSDFVSGPKDCTFPAKSRIS